MIPKNHICKVKDCENQVVSFKKKGKIYWRTRCDTHRYVTKKKQCFYCGFKIRLALNRHHLRRGETVVLCANCHGILHGLFGHKKLEAMGRRDVYNYLEATYKEYEIKETSLFPDLQQKFQPNRLINLDTDNSHFLSQGFTKKC